MSTDLKLNGKVAVITGGSDGIGYGIAETFVREGASLILIARNKKKLEKVAMDLNIFDTKINTFSVNLDKEVEVDQLVNDIKSLNIPIDIVVNNAGTAEFISFEKTTKDQLKQHIALNIYAPYRLTQGLLSELQKTKGNIINISSYFAQRMLANRPSTAYSLTKGAINSFTLSLAYELGPTGIRVNAIAPGTVTTPLVEKNLEKLSVQGKNRFIQSIPANYPLGRLGVAKDIANAALFLASNDASWITGETLAVDGGLTTH